MYLLVDFLVEDVILLFTWSADATNRASDKHRHTDRYQDSRQKIAEMRQVIQQVVHFKEPHNLAPLPKETASYRVVSIRAIIISPFWATEAKFCESRLLDCLFGTGATLHDPTHMRCGLT